MFVDMRNLAPPHISHIASFDAVLGDAVCMQTAATTDEALPAFFLHDCPREADMSIHLYSNYLLNLADMEQRLSTKTGEAAFQYIVTTTSPPPEALCKPPFLVLELKPEAEDSVLFRKQFGNVQEDWLQ